MSYLKKIGALFVSSALMASMLAGCGSSSDSTGGNGSQAEGGDGNYNISIVFKTTSNEYTQYMMAGAEKAAAETGAVLDMKGATSETAYDEQQNMIETDLHANKYDAMIIAPLQGDMASTLVSGTDMPIFAIDTDFNAPEKISFIGIGQKDDFGNPYEEWFITDYDCYVDGLYDKLGEYENLDELNYLASKLDEMSDSEYAQFQAGMEMGDHCGSLQEIINLTENLDCYEVYPDIHDYDDLGRYYIEELDVMQVPEHLQNYIDYEAYGRDVALEENGTFTDQGYVRDTGDSFHEYYDGERGSIPDEYRVMTFQDDLPEEEKSEWAMDIAFDMDEFFRQNDPQYAAEHPEAHAAKEEIYESLMAGRISALDEKLAALGQTQEDYLPSEIEKFKDATGYEEFLDFDPAEVKAALDDPEKSHADEMLSAAEKAASEKMTVLVVEPMKEPYVKEIDPDLHSLQAEVGGDIGATYPYSDPVALVCNDEGKLIGLDLNRGLRDENGEIYDIVAGTFLVVGLGEEDFASLSPELIQKYTEQFKTPERFMQINGNIVVLPVPAEKQDLAYLPDRFETGERVQTPRGSFQVTAMSREQMEAAGYGVHHISDDGKYLIMGNGTRAFAVAAEQPEKDNPLRTAEMTLEDDYGMIDGVINNGRRGEELEKAKEHAERTQPEKKPSIRERLAAAKQECAKQQPRPAPEKKPPELGEL